MRDHQMINDKILECRSKIMNLNWKQVFTILGTVGFGLLTVFLATLLSTTYTELFLPISISSAFLPVACFTSFLDSRSKKQALRERISSLQDMKENGITKNDELDKKRSLQIGKLEAKQKDNQISIRKCSSIGILSSLIWFLGCGLALAKPNAILMTIPGVAGFLGACTWDHKLTKKFLKNQNKLDSLKEALLLGPLYKKEEKVDIKEMEENLQEGKAMVNPLYLECVDQYIQSLEKNNDNNFSFQKVKNRG